MTFEQIFTGRILLMRAQRHIAQEFATVRGFRTPAGEEAFFIVERCLVDLEREFDAKKKLSDRNKKRSLDRRADRQVSA